MKKRKKMKNAKPYNARLLRCSIFGKHYLDSADVIKFKLLYIFHICGKEWYISIYINIWIYLFTDTLQLPFKTLQKLKLSSPISKVSTGKSLGGAVLWSVWFCSEFLFSWDIHFLAEPPGEPESFLPFCCKDVKMQEAVWHGGFQGLYLWLSGSLWNCVKMFFTFLMFCQMLLKCFYILNIWLYFPKKINVNRTAW